MNVSKSLLATMAVALTVPLGISSCVTNEQRTAQKYHPMPKHDTPRSKTMMGYYENRRSGRYFLLLLSALWPGIIFLLFL